MVEQVTNRDGLAVFRKFREEVGEMVVIVQLAVARQQHDARRRELLGKRRQTKIRLRIDGVPRVQIGNAVSATKDGPPIADHEHGGARRVAQLQRSKDSVDLG